tara:strand:+ start:1224 stop:1787 length:564 start_codon:yes stop_codon:yes gene_type:complete
MQEKIYLRPLNLNDINEKYLFWVNNPIVTEYLEIGEKHLEYEDLVEYVESSPKKGRYNFAVMTKDTDLHIGNSSIYSIEPNKKKFEIGWFVGEKKFWGGHYSSMIIFYLLKIGFIEMRLEKCIGGVDKRHVKARMTNKFSGFRETDTRIVEKNKKKTTFINLEITKKEWVKRAKTLHSQYPELYNEF